MGRWAYFSGTHKETGEDVEHQYKFWFGTQGSQIPWADERKTYEVTGYDEDYADMLELTEKQREFWREHEDDCGLEDSDFDRDEENGELLRSLCQESYWASDNDDDLAEHWAEVAALAEELGVQPFEPGDSPLKALEAYEKDVIDVACADKSKDYATKRANEAFLERLADLHIKTTVCCLLAEWGSYDCRFEV